MWRLLVIILGLVTLLCAPALAAQSESGMITFASQVEVTSRDITLLDLVSRPDSLADAWRRALAEVNVMRAPGPGKRTWLDGRRLRDLVSRARLDASISVLIPERVEILRVKPRVTAKMLAEAYLAEVRSRLGSRAAQTEIHNIQTGRDRVIPEGDLHLKVRLFSDQIMGRVPGQIEVRVDGRTVAKVRASAQVDIYGELLVAARSMPRHHVIEPEDVRLVRANLSEVGNTAASDPEQLVGMRTRTALGMGEAVELRALERAPLIKRGEIVTMVCNQGEMKITARGEAQQTGYLGSRIKLTNLASKRPVFGRVLPNGDVMVEF
jgi:flagella basal body P-ring formation protein FlgA